MLRVWDCVFPPPEKTYGFLCRWKHTVPTGLRGVRARFSLLGSDCTPFFFFILRRDGGGHGPSIPLSYHIISACTNPIQQFSHPTISTTFSFNFHVTTIDACTTDRCTRYTLAHSVYHTTSSPLSLHIVVVFRRTAHTGSRSGVRLRHFLDTGITEDSDQSQIDVPFQFEDCALIPAIPGSC